MRMKYVAMLMAGLVWIGTSGMVYADLVTQTFAGTVSDGLYQGAVGTGSFTYDTDLILEGDEILNVENGLTVAFSFGGQVFDESHDVDFDIFPELEFSDGRPVFLDYSLVDGQSDVNFSDPMLFAVALGEISLSPGDVDYDVELFAQAVPVPAAIWLLGSGIACIIGLGRKTIGKL